MDFLIVPAVRFRLLNVWFAIGYTRYPEIAGKYSLVMSSLEDGR
jgi:hypothetical protein